MFTRNISFVSLLFLCRDRKFGEGIIGTYYTAQNINTYYHGN